MGPLLVMHLPLVPEYEENINVTLKGLRYSHLNNVIFSYLNINSIRNKFGDLDKILDGNIDILCRAEPKLDEIVRFSGLPFTI